MSVGNQLLGEVTVVDSCPLTEAMYNTHWEQLANQLGQLYPMQLRTSGSSRIPSLYATPHQMHVGVSEARSRGCTVHR